MSRIMRAQSEDSESGFGGKVSDSRDFSIWSLIKRRTGEDPFCLTCKFRVNAKIRRSFSDTINRQRRPTETGINDDDQSDSSGSDSDWNIDQFDDELFDLYNSMDDKSDTGLVTDTKHGAFCRPLSGVDVSLVDNIVSRGTRAQKVYLKKCMVFQVTPSSIFLHALNTTHIDIGHQNIGPKGAEACAIALTQTSSVRRLDINDNSIGHKGAKFLAFMLKTCKTIKELNLADNSIGSNGLKYIAQVVIDYDKIQWLDLSNNGFRDDDAKLFKLMLEECRNLSYLNLSHNQFRERGGILLGEALSYNDGLEELDLSWNHLRRDGASALAEEILDNTSLKRLSLGWNGMYLEGSLGLQRMLVHNTTLEVLDLTSNRLSRECIGQLVKGLARNTILHTLVLKFNPLTLEGASDVMQFLVECPSSGIRNMDFGIQQVEPQFVTMITEVHLQQRHLSVTYGHVIGQAISHRPEYEDSLIRENPALVLIEFCRIMGFRLIDLFASMDKDGSRTLSKEEITTGLKLANIPFSDRWIERMIAKFDANDDGEISYTELLLAQQHYRDENQRFMLAQDGRGDMAVEDTKLWHIRLKLQKLLAEKFSDYSNFKRMSAEISRHIQLSKEAVEARIMHKRKTPRQQVPVEEDPSDAHAQTDTGRPKAPRLEHINENQSADGADDNIMTSLY